MNRCTVPQAKKMLMLAKQNRCCQRDFYERTGMHVSGSIPTEIWDFWIAEVVTNCTQEQASKFINHWDSHNCKLSGCREPKLTWEALGEEE